MKERPIGIPVRQEIVRLNSNERIKVKIFNALSFCLFFILNTVFKYRFKVIAKNLGACFPQVSGARQREMIRAYYRHLADLIVEPFMICGMKTDTIGYFAEFENLALLNQLRLSGRDVVLLTSHYGNWEYLFSLPLVTDYEVFAVYSPLSSRFLDRKMSEIRTRFGVNLVSRREWYRFVFKRESKKPALFIMVADQRPVPPFKHAVYFMGQETYVQAGIEKIARKLGCALVYVDAFKKARHRYEYRFKLLSENAWESTAGWILESYYKALENSIRRDPVLWLWSHDRWKNHGAKFRSDVVETEAELAGL